MLTPSSNVENCRNLGAFLGYFLGNIISMNHLTFTRIGQSFGLEYFQKSISKSKIYSYENLQRRWYYFLFGWYFSICQWRFIAEQDTEPLRVRYWESEWLNEWVGEEAPSRISYCLPTQFTLGLKRRTRYEPDRFFFYKWGQFQKWWRILHRTPDIGWWVFISNSLVCFRLRKYILQTIPDQTRPDHIRPD